MTVVLKSTGLRANGVLSAVLGSLALQAVLPTRDETPEPAKPEGEVARILRDRSLPIPERVEKTRELLLAEIATGKADIDERERAARAATGQLSTAAMDALVPVYGELTKKVLLYKELSERGGEYAAVGDLKEGKSTEERERGAQFLTGTTDRKALDVLCEVGLRDPHDKVRHASATALIGTTDRRTLDWLCGVGLEDPQRAVRFASASALEGTTNRKALDALCEVGFKDPDINVRWASAWTLKGTTDRKALDALCEVGLKDPISTVRYRSAWALIGTTDRKALDALCEVRLKDPEWEVRQVSVEALMASLKAPQFPEDLRSKVESALKAGGFQQ